MKKLKIMVLDEEIQNLISENEAEKVIKAKVTDALSHLLSLKLYAHGFPPSTDLRDRIDCIDVEVLNTKIEHFYVDPGVVTQVRILSVFDEWGVEATEEGIEITLNYY